MDLSSIERFVRVMPARDAPLDIRILKAHLLAEEALNKYLAEVLPRGKLLLKEKFSTKLRVAKANTLPSHNLNWLWCAFDKLNKLRNSFAHKIEDSKRAEKVEKFVAACRKSPTWARWTKDSTFDPITSAIFVSCNELGLLSLTRSSKSSKLSLRPTA